VGHLLAAGVHLGTLFVCACICMRVCDLRIQLVQ
jgi:hypothetical protein